MYKTIVILLFDIDVLQATPTVKHDISNCVILLILSNDLCMNFTDWVYICLC